MGFRVWGWARGLRLQILGSKMPGASGAEGTRWGQVPRAWSLPVTEKTYLFRVPYHGFYIYSSFRRYVFSVTDRV